MMQITQNPFTNIGNRAVFLILFAFAAGSLWRSVFDNAGNADAIWYAGFWQNFSTEMIGAIMTFALFELILGARREREQQAFFRKLSEQSAEQTRKALQANALARLRQTRTQEERQMIIDEMKAADLLKDANLRKMDFSDLNLDHADFSHANLYRANFSRALLREVNLSYANLRKAQLSGASLYKSQLTGANLHRSEWSAAQLDEVTLPDGRQWLKNAKLAHYVDDRSPFFVEKLSKTNFTRFQRGLRLLGMGHVRNPVYPLASQNAIERLDKQTMLNRVNTRRAQLGLEPLE